MSDTELSNTELTKVRIDVWLWAARFFKTRTLAKQAIESGKVHCEGQRVKASKEIKVGIKLLIRQGWDEKEIVVTGLSDRRRGAAPAALLYKETEESQSKREERSAQRKILGLSMITTAKPTKKERRQIHQFKQQQHDSEYE